MSRSCSTRSNVPEGLPSDHDAVESHRVHLTQVGRTSRLALPLPETLSCVSGDVVRLSFEGTVAYAAVDTNLHDEAVVRGAFPTKRLARASGEGEDRFAAWVDSADIEAGDPAVLDVVTAGYAYGIRRPGERVVYSPVDAPDGSLADIADSLGRPDDGT